jgi:predicted ferric reductase
LCVFFNFIVETPCYILVLSPSGETPLLVLIRAPIMSSSRKSFRKADSMSIDPVVSTSTVVSAEELKITSVYGDRYFHLQPSFSFILMLFSLVLFFNVLGTLVPGIFMVGYSWSHGTFHLVSVLGLVFFIISLMLGALSIGIFLIYISMYASTKKKSYVPLLSILFIFVGTGVGSFLSIQYQIVPWLTFRQVLFDGEYINAADTVQQYLGGWAYCIYPLLFIASGIILLQYSFQSVPLKPSSSDPGSPVDEDASASLLSNSANEQGGDEAAGKQVYTGKRPVQGDQLLSNYKGILALVVVFGFWFVACAVLSDLWNFSATSYFPYVSTWSLLPSSFVISFGPVPDPNDKTSINPIVVVKLYEDICVYYALIVGVALIGVVGTYTRAGRRILHRRYDLDVFNSQKWWPSSLRFFPQGATFGEMLILCVGATLYIYWVYYWRYKYTRIQSEATSEGETIYWALNVWARVMGHMTTLTMSFLTYPIARNSVWESVFGIPFDRAIKYHRVLGRLCWLFVTTHLLLWFVKWGLEGTLVNNMFTIDNLIITNGKTPAIHDDNFTIPLVEVAYVLLTISLIIANFGRRWNYELFQYTHYFVWLFYAAALTHAWSHWYYVVVGLFLYAFDKVIRLINSTNEVRLISIKHCTGITVLEIEARALAKGYYAGQYVWLNIPAVAASEFHPFTLSSRPMAGPSDLAQAQATGGASSPLGTGQTATLHIRDLGHGTWTHGLALLAKSLSSGAGTIDMSGGDFEASEAAGGVKASSKSRRFSVAPPHPSQVSLSLDGPYGRPGGYYTRDTVILVAGGIGVTPMHSILTDLAARSLPAVRKIHFIWVIREASIAAVFSNTLAELVKQNAARDSLIQFHIYCTGNVNGVKAYAKEPFEAGIVDDLADAELLLSIVRPGRPDLRAIFADVATDVAETFANEKDLHMPEKVAVLSCGPSSLINAVSTLSFTHDFDFHSEVFHY